MAFRQHFDDFFGDNLRKRERSRSRPPVDKSQKDEENLLEQGLNRFDRGTTPGRTLLSNLKPAPPRKSDVFELNSGPKCDLKQHFKEFMSTTNNSRLNSSSAVARARFIYIFFTLLTYIEANLFYAHAICSLIFFAGKKYIFTSLAAAPCSPFGGGRC